MQTTQSSPVSNSRSSTRPATLKVEVPRKLRPLLAPSRYKAAHGGRGGAKSHFYAEQVVLQVYGKHKRVVCIREIQESIKDSVKALIEQKIAKFGLQRFFDVTLTEIRGLDASGNPNGGLIVFRGMQSYNAENIKSLESFDIAWVEEAQTLSDISLRMLRPTIRKPGSELWFGWNPRFDTDAVDQFFRGAHPPKDSIIVSVNWDGNPWFPAELKDEKDRDYAADPEMAEHVWGGSYEIVSEGAYYARLIAQVEKEKRVGFFPYDPKQRLRTAWDLGMEDCTAIWFIQDNGVIPTVVDYFEINNAGFDEIVSNAMPELFVPPPLNETYFEWDKAKAIAGTGRPIPFDYALHLLPHDVRVRELGSGGRHRHQLLAELGLKNIKKGVSANPEVRVAASRRLLPVFQFHSTPRVLHGLKRLRHYKRKRNDQTGEWMGPHKDGNDHGADAFGEYCINCDLLPPVMELKPKPKIKPDREILTSNADGSISSNLSTLEWLEMKKRLADV